MSIGRRVLIAGCGDLGTRLGLCLASRGDAVFGLRRRIERLPPPIRGVAADLTDPSTLTAIPRELDAVVLCATPGARDVDSYRRTYLEGSQHVLDAAGNTGRVLFVSSTAVYGQDAGEWVDENSPTSPAAFNGDVLMQAERALRARGGEVVLARCSGLYGPGRERMLTLARREAVPPARWTNRIHIDDAAAALHHLLDLPAAAPVWLLNDDAPALEAEVLSFLRQRLGLNPLPQDTGAPRGKRVANTRLRASGWEPRYPDYRAGYSVLPAVGERA